MVAGGGQVTPQTDQLRPQSSAATFGNLDIAVIARLAAKP
jgi:hypothetical protein